MRTLVPTGYMLDRSDETGRMEIRLCGAGLGHKMASFDPIRGEWIELGENASGSHNDDENAPQEDASTCEFMLSLVSDLPETDTASIAAAFGLPLLAGRIYVSESHKPVITAPLPARGPPTLV